MRAQVSRIAGSCGLGVVYNFEYPTSWNSEVTKQVLKDYGGGTGYNIAAFVNGGRCKEMYDYIKTNHHIVYQSPVKMNRNSGRRFFFIVFKV